MRRPAQGFRLLTLIAAAMLMITMGSRQTVGLFIAPLNTATGLGIVAISLAAAIGQFTWGLAQPIFGALADRFGPGRVLVLGGLLLAGGLALTPFVRTELQLILVLGVMTAFGAGAGSFSILIGAVLQRLPAERRSFAAGLVNAGGSFGQFVFAPLLQVIITGFGWVTALLTMAAFCLATVPLAWPLRGRGGVRTAAASRAEATSLGAQLRVAWRDTSYWCLHLGFFTCGFHVAFLVTHLPGQVHLCGLDPVGLGQFAGTDRAGEYRRFPDGRLAGRAAADEVPAVRAVFQPCSRGAGVHGGAEDRADVLCVRAGAGVDLAGDGAADRRAGGKAVWRAVPGDAVRADAAVAPDRRFFWRLAGRARGGAVRGLHVDVVRGCRRWRCSRRW